MLRAKLTVKFCPTQICQKKPVISHNRNW